MTTQYRYAIHHDPPHRRPVHTFTSWTTSENAARMNLYQVSGMTDLHPLSESTFVLRKPSGEPCGSAELQTRAAPEPTGEGASGSKADALEPNSSWESDEKWRERDRLYRESQAGTTAYERRVQEMKEAHE